MTSQTNRSGQKWYVHPVTSERAWSVTTILKAMPKDALTYWAAREAATYAVDNLDVLAPLAAKGDAGREEAIELTKKAPWRSSGKKRDLGSEIHAAIESLVLDKPLPAPSPEAEPYLDQFLAFVDTWEPQFLASEAVVWNRTQKYAGTLDAVCKFVDGTILVDFKTNDGQGKSEPPYPDVAQQLAAYRHAEFMLLADGTEHPMPDVDGGACLAIFPDRYKLVPIECGPEIFNAFLYTREMYRWVYETSKTVLGQPKIRS
ncbi:MAG: hypothetical protein M3N32_07920 [Actinomycetota bacterium]|nr:hypothetical protein [Actinomycetota bacterium]